MVLETFHESENKRHYLERTRKHSSIEILNVFDIEWKNVKIMTMEKKLHTIRLWIFRESVALESNTKARFDRVSNFTRIPSQKKKINVS